ncbi:MAG: hypothetical protein V3V18_05785 [Methylococcales bacterium]
MRNNQLQLQGHWNSIECQVTATQQAVIFRCQLSVNTMTSIRSPSTMGAEQFQHVNPQPISRKIQLDHRYNSVFYYV